MPFPCIFVIQLPAGNARKPFLDIHETTLSIQGLVSHSKTFSKTGSKLSRLRQTRVTSVRLLTLSANLFLRSMIEARTFWGESNALSREFLNFSEKSSILPISSTTIVLFESRASSMAEHPISSRSLRFTPYFPTRQGEEKLFFARNPSFLSGNEMILNPILSPFSLIS